MRVARFNLATLRGQFSTQFAEWDAAVALDDTLKAKRVRREMQREARKGLSIPAAELGGFYLFLDPDRPGLTGLNYVGIADTAARSIGRRIEDRLKDDTALDPSLDELDDLKARQIIRRRLICALPSTGHRYVEKHIRVRHLFQKSPSVILLGADVDTKVIREAEKALIGSAASAGAPLKNIQHIGFRGQVSVAAQTLAESVIYEATTHGLPTNGADIWKALMSATPPA